MKLVNRENKLGRHLPLTAFWVTGEKARENGEGEKQDKRACAWENAQTPNTIMFLFFFLSFFVKVPSCYLCQNLTLFYYTFHVCKPLRYPMCIDRITYTLSLNAYTLLCLWIVQLNPMRSLHIKFGLHKIHDHISHVLPINMLL